MPTAKPTPYELKRPEHLRALQFVFLCAVILSLGSGCKLGNLTGNDKRYDLIEAELRTRERELIEARSELAHLRLLTQTYQRQPNVWTDPAFVQRPGVDNAAPTMPLRDIALGNGTGGVDDDNLPGDESLMVVIAPKDPDGTIVKIPGKAAVSAYEINRQGLKTQIGQWDVTPDQLRRAWKSGLLSNGYFVPLQWDRAPTTDRLRLAVRFTTLDGANYEADKDVTVRPLAGLPLTNPSIPSTAVPTYPMPSFGGAEELPPPRSPDGQPAARFKRAIPTLTR